MLLPKSKQSKTEEITKTVVLEYDIIKENIITSKLIKEYKQQLIKFTRPYDKTTRFLRIYFNPINPQT